MAKSKKSQQQEEELIEVVKTTENEQGMLDKNQMTLLGVAAILLLCIGAYLAYKHLYQAPKNKEAMEQMFRAEMQFKRDSFALALENPGADAEGFLDIVDNYSGTSAGNLAKYYAGVSYLNLGKFDEAIEYLESFSAAGDVTPTMKSGVLADAYAETGDLDKALGLYAKAANGSDNEFLAPYYLKKLGMLQQKQGDADKASKTFMKIKEMYPTSNEGLSIDRYLSNAN